MFSIPQLMATLEYYAFLLYDFFVPTILQAVNMIKANINQTDFDSTYSPEQIEYIAVQGENVTDGSVSPGKNPCQAVLNGAGKKM